MPKIMSGNHCTEWSWPFTQSWTLRGCGSTFRCTLTHSKIYRRKGAHSIQWAPRKCTWRWNLDVCPNFKSLEKVKQNKEVSTLIKYTIHCFKGRWKSQVPLWWWKKKQQAIRNHEINPELDLIISHLCTRVWRCGEYIWTSNASITLHLIVRGRVSHWLFKTGSLTEARACQFC